MLINLVKKKHLGIGNQYLLKHFNYFCAITLKSPKKKLFLQILSYENSVAI